jgi:hypothetical protein
MPNFMPATQPGRVGRTTNLSSSVVNSYSKVNADRQTRQQARERRRRGDWDILEIPTALLWLDVCEAVAFDPYQALECEAAAVTDLWP